MFLYWESPSSLIGAQLLCVDLTSSFFIKFERIGCIRVATMVIVSNNHSLRSLTCLNQWNASSHGQSKLIDLLFSNHPHNRH